MAFSLGGLTAYTKQLVKPLLTAAVFDAKTQQMIMKNGIVIPNVKSSAKIPLLDTDVNFQAQSCSFDPSGTTTITQRTVTVGAIKVEEKLCPKDLEAYFTQEAMKAGSTLEDFGIADFQKVWLDRKNQLIAKQLETAIWQGDTSSSDINLKRFDGLVKLIDAGSPVDANVSGYTGITGSPVAQVTASNVISCTEGIYKAIPTAVLNKKNVTICVGDDWFRLLVLAYRALNLYAYKPEDGSDRSFVLPGTDVTVSAFNGLNGLGDAYAFDWSNVALGVDLVDEETAYRMWYSEDNNDVRFRAEWKMGVNVAFTNECVKFKSTI